MVKLTMVVAALFAFGCGDGSAARKKLAAQLETSMRSATGVAVKVSTRGEGGTVLVIEGIGGACDEAFLAMAFSDGGPGLAPQEFVDVGFKRAECELDGRVTGVELPVDRSSSRKERMFADSKEKIAKMAVDKYAFEAYSVWASENPSKICPDRLDDLNQYMNNKDSKDPWGAPYRMKCGATLPPSVKAGVAIDSAGPDQKWDTEDDIKSW